MEEREEISTGPSSKSRTDLKFMGEQRNGDGFEESHELACKHVKVRDLDSVLASEESCMKSIRTKEFCEKKIVSSNTMSQITDVPEAVGKRNESIPPSSKKHNEDHNVDRAKQRLDHNIEAGCGSDNCDLSCSSKNQSGLRPMEISETVNSIGPLLESDSMRVWREMKRNGFLSCPLGGVSSSNSAVSSCHGGAAEQKKHRRKQSGSLKAKKELVKEEQVDKFSKLAAPSGLLNGLNPGIINNVRNKKQVRSILEALVKRGSEDAGTGKNPG